MVYLNALGAMAHNTLIAIPFQNSKALSFGEVLTRSRAVTATGNALAMARTPLCGLMLLACRRNEHLTTGSTWARRMDTLSLMLAITRAVSSNGSFTCGLGTELFAAHRTLARFVYLCTYAFACLRAIQVRAAIGASFERLSANNTDKDWAGTPGNMVAGFGAVAGSGTVSVERCAASLTGKRVKRGHSAPLYADSRMVASGSESSRRFGCTSLDANH